VDAWTPREDYQGSGERKIYRETCSTSITHVSVQKIGVPAQDTSERDAMMAIYEGTPRADGNELQFIREGPVYVTWDDLDVNLANAAIRANWPTP
jgi:hypothetical protein